LGRLATWEDWLAIGVAIDIGRQHAMRVSGKNTPEGRGYNPAFNQWLKDGGFDRLDKGDRKRLMDCIDHHAEIEDWRRILTLSRRLRVNYPSVVWRRWRQSVQEPRPRQSKPVKAHIVEVGPSHIAELKAARDGYPHRDHSPKIIGYPTSGSAEPSCTGERKGSQWACRSQRFIPVELPAFHEGHAPIERAIALDHVAASATG
jgi:hypothetical protein